ncbi:MAG: 50S ribosomal protein L21 [Bacteroidales bacterium]|nr:50S ribosomal protein L21 [Bacteroidales bacterium]MCF8390899.1 50S ribosomal protein L21 [Bacteroidales bacterium]
MYAIVDIAGQQFKVEKDTKVFVHRLEGTEGSKVEFDKVLLIDNDKSVVVGTPVINGAMVTAEIISHMKGDKVIVFKKKRRKGYRVKNGHRQYMTHILVTEILEKGAKKAAPKAEAKAVSTPKEVVAEKPAAKAPVEKKTAAPKVAPAKKEAAPKATASAAKKPAAKKPAAKPAASAAKKPAASAAKPAAKKPAAKKADK